MEVEVYYVGIPHYYAVCLNCGWKYEDALDRRKGQREIRKHVSLTGHEVSLEKCAVSRYAPKGDELQLDETAAVSPPPNYT